jgi:hypothetical protein
MIAYLPLVNGKSFDEIKLRFLMVNQSLISWKFIDLFFKGFSNRYESELFSLAFDSINKFLFHPRSTSVNSSMILKTNQIIPCPLVYFMQIHVQSFGQHSLHLLQNNLI